MSEWLYSQRSLLHLPLLQLPMLHSGRQAWRQMPSSCSSGGGRLPKVMVHSYVSKLGSMCNGTPSSVVKKCCTGDLQRLTHMPAHCDSARYLQRRAQLPFISRMLTVKLHGPYLHRSMCTADFCIWPSTSASWIFMGPTSLADMADSGPGPLNATHVHVEAGCTTQRISS